MRYDEVKCSLVKILNRIAYINNVVCIDAVGEAKTELLTKLESNRFHLVVLGQFKRGKSTFINYLIGEDVLPTGVVPLTSIITKISYSKHKRAVIVFNDDTQLEAPLSDIHGYCTEEGNPLNIKNVSEIQIGYPFEFDGKDVVLIDTPGIASIYRHNTDIAYGSVNKADAVVFVLSADPPVSDAEMNFLSRIACDVDRIFFLLNKADYLDDCELYDVRQFTEKTLNDTLRVNDVSVFPVSLKFALEGRKSGNTELIEKSGIEIPIAKIKELLLKEKRHILVNSHIRGIKRIVTMCRDYLESAINLKKKPLCEIEKKIKIFDDFVKQISAGEKQMDVLFNNAFKEFFESLEEEMLEFGKKAGIQIEEEIRSFDSVYKESNRFKRQKGLENRFEDILVGVLDEFREESRQKIEKWYKEEIAEYILRFNRLIDKVKKVAEEIFDLNMDSYDSLVRPDISGEFRYKIGYEMEALEINPVYFTFPLPKRMVAKLILGRIIKRMDIDIDRNIGRIRYDFLRIIEGSYDTLNKKLSAQIDSMVATVQKLASNAICNYKKEKDEFVNEYTEYNSLLIEIEGLLKEVHGIEKNIIEQ